jgi:DHA2 family multidrug resistance protein
LKKLDAISLALLAVALASLEIGLKQAPHSGWFSAVCLGLFALCAGSTVVFVFRTRRAVQRVVEIALFKVRPFAIGCALSFCLGVGLFGAVYLIPVFLAYVRGHDALQIGSIMLVTGAAQLAAAPIAGALESRIDSRLLSALGFALFAVGLGWSAFESRIADFDEMFWPQALRGFAAMFCLLPPTRLALETLPHKQVPDASGLFNMMRNLGGAVGIALIDTVLYGRTNGHAEAIRQRLIAGDSATAQAIGLDRVPQDVSSAGAMIDQAAFAMSCNEAWALLAAIAAVGLLLIPCARGPVVR